MAWFAAKQDAYRRRNALDGVAVRGIRRKRPNLLFFHRHTEADAWSAVREGMGGHLQGRRGNEEILARPPVRRACTDGQWCTGGMGCQGLAQGRRDVGARRECTGQGEQGGTLVFGSVRGGFRRVRPGSGEVRRTYAFRLACAKRTGILQDQVIALADGVAEVTLVDSVELVCGREVH